MRFVINGIAWQVFLVDSYDERLLMPYGYTLGVTDLVDKAVYIANDLSPEKMYNVLLHEIVHCYIFSYGIATSIPCEETMCQVVENYGDDIENLTNYIYDCI